MRTMTEEEIAKFEEFKKTGNNDLDVSVYSGVSWTDEFERAIRMMGWMFHGLDFSKPFRLIFDYDPEQPRVVKKLRLPEESVTSEVDEFHIRSRQDTE